ncbi:hypothetical protein Tco_1498924 [Tanacetum coccineum]
MGHLIHKLNALPVEQPTICDTQLHSLIDIQQRTLKGSSSAISGFIHIDFILFNYEPVFEYFNDFTVDLSLASKPYPPFEQVVEISLWGRLGKAAMLNIESSSFSRDMLSSLHHTEHSSSNEHP